VRGSKTEKIMSLERKQRNENEGFEARMEAEIG
jgi:hypothetical protein